MKSTNTHIEIDELIATYLSQGLEAEKLAELENWLKASPENQKHFQQMREIWFSTISANEKERYNKEEAYSRFLNRTRQTHQKEKTVKKLSLHKFFYGAAAVALLCLISFASYRTGTEQVKKQFAEMVVEAPLGSKTRLYLPDGTLVWLNAGSTITYSQGFGVEERKLKLSGEGYFEVTHNKQLPFEITTKELQLKVLGTKFNFRNYPEDEEVSVSLLEGKVCLRNYLKNDALCYLEPDQKAILNKKNGKLMVSASEARYTAEWTNGFLFFDEELLPDIIKELERSYNVKIYIEDESLKTFRFYGTFVRKEQTIQEILEMLASTGKLEYRIKGKTVRLSSR
ncbi:FecR domain-containing protein [uncultured Parabacteroides sp.]|uniref:FecR family protein n=1 Tax=uncultured Parabacteroides sp. TaxID=512312 RepID=UPI0025947536|nr:FecR domain-containing protein [uncultured Parabacteroides sp.]